MLLSAVSVLVVAQSSSEIPEGLMNNPVYYLLNIEDSKTQARSAIITSLTMRKNMYGDVT